MKNLSFMLSILLFITSCNQEIDSNIIQRNDEKLISDYFATFNKHEWKKLSNYYADSTILKDPAFGLLPIKQSKLDIQKKYEVLHQSITDVHDSVVKIYTAKDHVIVEFLSRGTAPDGVKFSLPICTIFGFENGKIVEDFTYYDNF
jgi:ketosteroid isomerase-like protein